MEETVTDTAKNECQKALTLIRGGKPWREFAKEVGNGHSISHSAVHLWFLNGEVPSKWVGRLMMLAHAKGLSDIKPRHLNQDFDL